jgi:hypothetical protein
MRSIESIFDYLMDNGPWDGTGVELAEELGLKAGEFSAALHHVRSPKWIDEHAWTIPYVGQGPGKQNVYAITEATGIEHLWPGTKIRGKELLSFLRRWEAHSDLGEVLADGRSVEGRWLKTATPQIKAMIALAEALELES